MASEEDLIPVDRISPYRAMAHMGFMPMIAPVLMQPLGSDQLDTKLTVCM